MDCLGQTSALLKTDSFSINPVLLGKMQRRHVNHREEYAEDEDTLCLYTGYLMFVKRDGMRPADAARMLVTIFPTDRGIRSIETRLLNHTWWDTRGKRGMYGLRERGKQYWRTQMTEEDFARLEEIVRAKEVARRTRA